MPSKATSNTDRATIGEFTSLRNVGKSVAADLKQIGLRSPQDLIGQDPWGLYHRICIRDGTVHDPCLLDVLMAAVDYMHGKPPRNWWSYTEERKRKFSERIDALAAEFAAGNQKRRGLSPRR